jgi:hypothetical protein
MTPAWRVQGSYFEACNCEAVCPCRRLGGRGRGRSTYGVCDFALSWWVRDGFMGDLVLDGLAVVMAGSFTDEDQRSPWRVALYVDERATPAQDAALTGIFLGRAGGQTLQNFAAAIGEVVAIRRARIALDHTPGRERARAGGWVRFATAHRVPTAEPVTCGIPGHDRPGQELVAETLAVDDGPFQWTFQGRCGFAGDFDYRADN